MGIRKELWPVENGNYRLSLFTILNTMENGFKKDVLSELWRISKCLMDMQSTFKYLLTWKNKN